MSFLQNFHISPGQTIRSSRGFKWNPASPPATTTNTTDQNQNPQPQLKSPLAYKTGKPFPQLPLSATTTPKSNPGSDRSTVPVTSPTPRGLNNKGQGIGGSSNGNGTGGQQPVMDFNYTPSHQKPYIHPPAGTIVTSHQDIKEIVETTLGSEGVLNQAVKLPRGENENEWLAVHVVDFYNQINMLYGTITEFCSPTSCPRIIATNEYEYLWAFEKGKPPVSVSAPTYVECLMRWCQDQFDDEQIFPSKKDGVFPERFAERIVVPILRRLFRVYAHIYCHHFNEILELNLQTVLNTSFRHFCLFAQEFSLLRPADFGPLLELVLELRDR